MHLEQKLIHYDYPNQLTVCPEAIFILSEGLGEVIWWVSCFIVPVDHHHTWEGGLNGEPASQQSLAYLGQGRGGGGGGTWLDLHSLASGTIRTTAIATPSLIVGCI